MSGCFFDPYKKSKNGENVIKEWFSYKNGEDNLGATRKRLEEIGSIESIKCEFYIKDKGTNYIFKCEVGYLPLGETIIPLERTKIKTLYALFIPNGKTYEYKVYNSNSIENVWEIDSDINWEK